MRLREADGVVSALRVFSVCPFVLAGSSTKYKFLRHHVQPENLIDHIDPVDILEMQMNMLIEDLPRAIIFSMVE